MERKNIQIIKNKHLEEESILAFIPLIVFFLTFLVIYFIIKLKLIIFVQ